VPPLFQDNKNGAIGRKQMLFIKLPETLSGKRTLTIAAAGSEVESRQQIDSAVGRTIGEGSVLRKAVRRIKET
jgi:hypothetical protein